MTRRIRNGYLTATGLAVLVIGGISVAEIIPRLIWNASASLPLGLYAVQPIGDLTIGDLVAVTPPEPIARFIVARGYVGPGVPLLKRVAALSGTRAAPAPRSSSTTRLSAKHASATASAGRCPSGKAAGWSARARYSS